MESIFLLFAAAACLPAGCFLARKNKLWLFLSFIGGIATIWLRTNMTSELTWQETFFMVGLLALTVVAPISAKALELAQKGEKERSSRWGIAAGIIVLICAALMLPWPFSMLLS